MGGRGHLRDFGRHKDEFCDLMLGRFYDADILSGEVAEHETDIQWDQITELELIPHSVNVQCPDTIEAEYGMEGSVLKVCAREESTC